MKKILIVNSFYYPNVRGGAEVSTQLLAEGLREKYDVSVLTTGEHRKGIIKDLINGVKVYRLPLNNIYWPGKDISISFLHKIIWHTINNFNFFQNKQIRDILQEISPDIIHTQNLMGIGTSIWKIAKKLKMSVVHTTRDYALFEPVSHNFVNKCLSVVNKKRSTHVDYAIGISHFILNRHLEKGFFNKSIKASIHNIVNAPRFQKKKIEKDTPLTIGVYGQLELIKGIDILIKAVHLLPESVVGKVIICGVGKEKENLYKLSQGDKRFTFRGKVDVKEVYRIMANTNLTVVPSRWEEPFGRVIIESYAQGTPVIAADVGGIPEVVFDKKYLFKKENVIQLTEQIQKINALDCSEKRKLSSQCYLYSDKFLNNISQYQEIYDSLTGINIKELN